VTTSDLATRWLSPTSAWRLMTCPASLGPPHNAIRSLKPNAGTLAHRALQHWIETGDWADPAVRRERLVGYFNEAARAALVDIAVLRDGRLTQARLAARADQLSSELAQFTAYDASIACEEALSDPQNHLRGIPDITILGSRSAVIDFKTGQDATASLTERIRLQLLIYAHLYRCAHDRLPEIVEAFSLIHGPLRVSADSASVDAVINTITESRSQDPNLDRPSPAACRFCSRRFVCEQHWNALPTWEAPDALEGRITQIEHARSGAVGLLVMTASESQWITSISRDRIPIEAEVGSYVRIIHIHRTQTHDPQAALQAWRAGPFTSIRICLQCS
jgi:PD-(D/E)XK nuclease superfamily